VVILSDDDPIVDFARAREAFQANLGAEIVVEHGKGHLNEDSGLTELPSALQAVLS
jgi:predicted alpha/beta hydrolase family esterase